MPEFGSVETLVGLGIRFGAGGEEGDVRIH